MASGSLVSFLNIPEDTHFSMQNLPYGVFRPTPEQQAWPGVAIGEYVLDLSALARAGLFHGPVLKGSDCFLQTSLNAFMAVGRPAWKEARRTIQKPLSGFHGSLLEAQPYLEDVQGYTTHCLLLGRAVEVSLQDAWYGFTPGVSLDCVPGRLEYIRGGGITVRDSVIIETDSLGRDQKTLVKEEALLFACHRGLLVEVLKVDFWTEEAYKWVLYRGFLEEAYPTCRVLPRIFPSGLLAIRDNTDWRYEIFYFVWLQCLLFFTVAEHFQVACTLCATQHGAKERRTKPLIYARPSVYHHDEEGYECNNYISDSGYHPEIEKYQIFVKMTAGKSMLVWVSAQDTGESLKTLIMQLEGYSPFSFYILHEGKVLNESDRLWDRQIHKDSTLHVMFRLRGGKFGNRGTAGPSSYKDAARSKGPSSTADPLSQQPKPYIVEKLDDIPSLEVKNIEVTQLFSTLQTNALICRFNGFWPRSYDLHNWIFTNWTTNCQILLCSKGFFVVQFESKEEYQKIIEQGPWFWGRAGLFLTPWFPDFDANSMVVTKMPVWVRLPNLPLPFWHHLVLEDIGNLIGKFIKSDTDRNEKGLFTYARICVEIDLSKGLPDRIQLIYEKHKWIQALDFENTAFRCRFCHLTGHLQDSCPHAKRFPKKKQGMKTKGKTWQADYAPSTDEESEGDESELEEKQEQEANEETVHKAETVEAHYSDSKNTGKETLTENMHLMVTSSTGSKRAHESENSDSDKEKISSLQSEGQASKELIIAAPQQGGWKEVKSKKKGKKGKLEDYYNNL